MVVEMVGVGMWEVDRWVRSCTFGVACFGVMGRRPGMVCLCLSRTREPRCSARQRRLVRNLRILPFVDRFIRGAGWAASAMDAFLTLCERAKASYRAEDFANQILVIIGKGSDKSKWWYRGFIPARIAELVQHFAHREARMKQLRLKKLLRILDTLVDMGDRRSAMLQLSGAFCGDCLTLGTITDIPKAREGKILCFGDRLIS